MKPALTIQFAALLLAPLAALPEADTFGSNAGTLNEIMA